MGGTQLRRSSRWAFEEAAPATKNVLFGILISDTVLQLILDGDIDADLCVAANCLVNGIPADGILTTGIGAGIQVDCTSQNPLPGSGTIQILPGFNPDVIPGSTTY